jgi:hypothetical protein
MGLNFENLYSRNTIGFIDQQDMFRRDRAIARNDKRRQARIHIYVLAYELAKTLPTDALGVSVLQA